MHVRIVEEVAFDPPGIGEQLLPFFARINDHVHAVGRDRRRLRAGGGVQDQELPALRDQQLLAVGGDRELHRSRGTRASRLFDSSFRSNNMMVGGSSVPCDAAAGIDQLAAGS